MHDKQQSGVDADDHDGEVWFKMKTPGIETLMLSCVCLIVAAFSYGLQMSLAWRHKDGRRGNCWNQYQHAYSRNRKRDKSDSRHGSSRSGSRRSGSDESYNKQWTAFDDKEAEAEEVMANVEREMKLERGELPEDFLREKRIHYAMLISLMIVQLVSILLLAYLVPYSLQTSSALVSLISVTALVFFFAQLLPHITWLYFPDFFLDNFAWFANIVLILCLPVSAPIGLIFGYTWGEISELSFNSKGRTMLAERGTYYSAILPGSTDDQDIRIDAETPEFSNNNSYAMGTSLGKHNGRDVEYSTYRHIDELSLNELDVVKGTLGLREVHAATIMTPIDSVYMLNEDTILDDKRLIEVVNTGHSRIPVYRQNRENIVGMLMVKQMVRVRPEQRLRVSDFNVHPILAVASQLNLLEILSLFTEGNGQMAIVSKRSPLRGNNNADEEVGGLPPQEEIVYGSYAARTREENYQQRPFDPEGTLKDYVRLIGEWGIGSISRSTSTKQGGLAAIGIITMDQILELLLSHRIKDEKDSWLSVRERFAGSIEQLKAMRNELKTSLHTSPNENTATQDCEDLFQSSIPQT